MPAGADPVGTPADPAANRQETDLLKRWRTDGPAHSSLHRGSVGASACVGAAVAAARFRCRGVRREDVGISVRCETGADQRLSAQRDRDRRASPGAVMLIQRTWQARSIPNTSACAMSSARQPMSAGLRSSALYSMSKPITSVAVMMLVEDGKLSARRSASTSTSRPSPMPRWGSTSSTPMADRRCHGSRCADRSPLQDLLRHTSGITYGIYGDDPARKRYAGADLFNGEFRQRRTWPTASPTLPLAEQPGMLWDYGHSTDVLGRVVEVVSGKSLLQVRRVSGCSSR